MDLLELNSIFEGKYTGDKVVPKHRTVTEEEFNEFKGLLGVSELYVAALQNTEISSEFYDTCELLKRVISPEIQEDVFYAAKLGFYFEGVPTKLTYLLSKALKQYKYPNLAISAINRNSFGNYLKEGSLPEGVTVKRIISNLVGRPVTLLTKVNRKAETKLCCEMYVNNTDRVILLPRDISDQISTLEDMENIQYVEGVGVCLGDIPLRTFGGRTGLTKSDYDLRECM